LGGKKIIGEIKKMKIGLVDVDGHNFPNLALMKISAYHKSIGDSVEWVTIGRYDKTYMSKVFTFTPDYELGFSEYGEIIKGGTGYMNFIDLPPEIDKMSPDYTLYPNTESAYGFLTRGCIRNCPWCIVPKKEGMLRPYMDIEEFLQDKKSAILMDNNVLAHEYGLSQIEKIVRLRIKIDFNQGLDARIIAENEHIAELLGRVKWLKQLRMACDTKYQMPYIEKATYLLRKHGCKPQSYFIYVLVKDIDDALERVEFLRQLKLTPFAQPYLDFETGKTTKELKRFARWVNHKAIFNTVSFENYKA
jgi:radical SAM superfamily enzyme YgiQ (UPF0313 family)